MVRRKLNSDLRASDHHCGHVFPPIDFGEIPAGAIVGEPSNAARVEVKRPIFVEVGAGDAANDTQDWKVVADDDDPLRLDVAPHDLIEPIPCALGDVGKSFAAGYANLGGVAAAAHQKISIRRFGFVETETFQVAASHLTRVR